MLDSRVQSVFRLIKHHILQATSVSAEESDQVCGEAHVYFQELEGFILEYKW